VVLAAMVGVGAGCARVGDRSGDQAGDNDVESARGGIISANNTITQAADEQRTGWYPDQPGLDPSIVGSASFKRLFQTTLPLKDPNGNPDFVYAQPLVNGNRVFVASASNNIYSLDAATGAVLAQRNLGKPFDPSILQCGDQKWVGTTGTAVIDALTNTAYFFSKVVTTDNSKPEWYFRAVDASTLADKFAPVRVAGNAANDPTVAFFPELEHQRPGVLLLNGVVYGAFGAHCDKNLDTVKYRGWIVGFTTAGVQTTMYTTEDHTGTQAGIWNSGGGLVSDGPGRIFYITGNGSAAKAPTAGTAPPLTLGQSLVRVDVQADKSLKTMQFFEPYNLIGDQDFAAGSPVSLPSQYFGTAAFPHLMVAASCRSCTSSTATTWAATSSRRTSTRRTTRRATRTSSSARRRSRATARGRSPPCGRATAAGSTRSAAARASWPSSTARTPRARPRSRSSGIRTRPTGSRRARPS
jgi:hypothetical protein